MDFFSDRRSIGYLHSDGQSYGVSVLAKPAATASEAPDECGHSGKGPLKVEAIEAFDEKIVGPIWQAMEERGEPYRLLICTDHRTPVSVRGHTREPVPMAKLDGPVGPVQNEQPFDEFVHGGIAEIKVYDWMRELLKSR